jgi:lactoylglutathione lyase
MKIEHIAMWVNNLEEMKHFYLKYFDASANNKYINSKKGFESYFLSFTSGARLEIMHMSSIFPTTNEPSQQKMGFIHVAFSLGSKQKVDELTKTLAEDGFNVVDGPRTTGDGYYESVVLDPEGNRVELTI